jgi:hypothetical protein
MIERRHHPTRIPFTPGVFQLACSLVTLGSLASAGCNTLFEIHHGTPRPICTDTNPSELLIDDMEDRDGFICMLGGRNGHWYTTGDRTPGSVLLPQGNLDPTKIEGMRGSSQFAAHFAGSGLTKWGAAMGFALNALGTGTTTVDVHTVTGIRFWMRSTVPVDVNFRTPETMAPKDGGQCVDSDTALNCDNDFGFPITAPSRDWTEYQVPFDALRQLQHGGTAAWNPRFLDSIQFNVGPGAPFDVWVDDIRFFYCNETTCLPTCTPDRPIACPATDSGPASCMPPATDCAAVATWCATPLLIDDMEDADASICFSDGRQGGWSTNAYDSGPDPGSGVDMEFKQTLILGGRGESHYAAHMAGTGISGLTRMGFELEYTAAGEADYDGSKFDGIRFWLKSDVPVIVGFTSPETLPASQNGTCDTSAAQENCHHHFEFVTAATGNEWLDYKVPFSALRQAADHDAPANVVPPNATWDASRLRAIAFLTSSPDFDVWVDDIAFYTCGAEVCGPTCTGDTPVSCAASGGRPAGCWPAGTDCSTAAYFSPLLGP